MDSDVVYMMVFEITYQGVVYELKWKSRAPCLSGDDRIIEMIRQDLKEQEDLKGYFIFGNGCSEKYTDIEKHGFSFEAYLYKFDQFESVELVSGEIPGYKTRPTPPGRIPPVY
jgi:hypothetical protein